MTATFQHIVDDGHQLHMLRQISAGGAVGHLYYTLVGSFFNKLGQTGTDTRCASINVSPNQQSGRVALSQPCNLSSNDVKSKFFEYMDSYVCVGWRMRMYMYNYVYRWIYNIDRNQ